MPHLGARSMDSVVYDSIRCGVRNGGYRGSDQGESGGYSSQFSVRSQTHESRRVYGQKEKLEPQGAQRGTEGHRGNLK